MPEWIWIAVYSIGAAIFFVLAVAAYTKDGEQVPRIATTVAVLIWPVAIVVVLLATVGVQLGRWVKQRGG